MAAPTYVNHGTGVVTGTSITVTNPSGTQSGDYMLVHIQHSTGNLGADGTAPSGWSLIGTRQQNSSSTHWYYEKLAGGSEPASWDWTGYASATLEYGIVVVRGADQTTPRHTEHLLQNTDITGTTVALSVTTSVADCLLVAFAGQDQTVGGNTWSQASMTERYDESLTADLTHCGYTETAATATTYNRTITASTAQRISGALIAVAPASGTTFNLDQTTETDTALGLAAAKSSVLGMATELDSVFAVAVTKTVVLGLATETDEAFALTASNDALHVLGLATETDAATTLAASKVVTLGLATEADETFSVVVSKVAVLGIATEAGSALSLMVAKATPLGLATETSTALAITAAKAYPLGLATEADETFALVLTEPRDIVVIARLRSNHVTGGVGLTDLVAGLHSNHITGGVDVPRNMLTGSVEYVTAEVTFVGETAASIATVTGQVKITSDDTIPSSWEAVDVTERTDVTGGALLALKKLHTAGTAGEYRVWAKVTDNPEIPILKCGTFTVR